YGAWTSPFTSEFTTSTEIVLGRPAAVGADVYWLEGRPTEGGRVVVVRRNPDGATTDGTPDPFTTRTKVHEYGGGAAALARDRPRRHRVRLELRRPARLPDRARVGPGTVDPHRRHAVRRRQRGHAR